MPRAKRYYVIPAYGVTPLWETYTGHKTIAAARKELAEVVRDDLRECRGRHRQCATVGTVKEKSVEIKIGSKQGYHTWQRWIITER